MYCRECGKEIREEDRFCPYCGAVNRMHGEVFEKSEMFPENVYIDAQPDNRILEQYCSVDERVMGQKEVSMKWYKFVIYFQLFAAAIFGLYHGFMRITGMQYGTNADQVYNFFGMGLRVLDIFFGIMPILAAAAFLYVRQCLIKLKKNAPLLYLSVFILNGIIETIYAVVLLLLVGGNGEDAGGLIGQVLGLGIYYVLNYIYFKKRKHLFQK